MKIVDPEDNKVYNLNSYKGKHILKQYIKFYQSGGHFVEVSERMLSNANTFGNDSCAANAFNWMGYSIFKNIFLSLKLAGQSITTKQTHYETDVLTSSGLLYCVKLIEDAIRDIDKEIENSAFKRITKDTKQPVHSRDFSIINEDSFANDAIKEIKNILPRGHAGFLMCDWYGRQVDIDHGAHIVCIMKDIKNELRIIELQSCKSIVTGEKKIHNYFKKMDFCELIIGALTLKSPTTEFAESSVNPGDREGFEESMGKTPILRRSNRVIEERTGYEKRAIEKVMDKIESIFSSPEKLKSEAEHIEELLKEQIKKERFKIERRKKLTEMLKNRKEERAKEVAGGGGGGGAAGPEPESEPEPKPKSEPEPSLSTLYDRFVGVFKKLHSLYAP